MLNKVNLEQYTYPVSVASGLRVMLNKVNHGFFVCIDDILLPYFGQIKNLLSYSSKIKNKIG